VAKSLAISKQETALSQSNSKQASTGVPLINLKPFSSGIAPRRLTTTTKTGEGDAETKEENITSHAFRTTNH